MMQKQLPIWVLVAAPVILSCILVLAVAGFSDLWAWIFVAILVGMTGFFMLMLWLQNPSVLRRRLPSPEDFPKMQSYWIVTGITGVVTAGLSVYDNLHVIFSPMPAFFSYVGMLLLFCGGLLAFQTATAKAPHCQDYYGEENPRHEATGIYKLVRFPMQLSVFLMSLGIPVYFMSLAGLAPALIQMFVLIAFIRNQEEFRFARYDWFFDYRKEVPYRLIPLIW